MSTPLNTTDEGEDESFKFDKWIEQNQLNEVKSLFVKHNMVTASELHTSSAGFFKLMSDAELIQKAYMMPKIMTALQNVPAMDVKPKIIRIFISKQEEDAINKLNTYGNKIADLQQQIKTSNNSLTQNVKECNTNITSTFNQIFHKMKSKQQQIENKLKNIQQQKRSQIDAKSHKINTEQKKVQKAVKTCALLQEDEKLDRDKRQTKVISIVDDIINNKLEDTVADIDTKIIFDFNKDLISQFIDNLGDIHASQQHTLPIIENVECKDITSTTAAVHFDATLLDKDKDKKVKSILLIKLEYTDNENDDIDEKKQNYDQCPVLQFDKNQKHYEFDLKSLAKNKDYRMHIHLYQSENKQIRKISNYKPILVQFKTSSYDIDTTFVYSSDFDTNGICYGLGSNYGKKEFSNPYVQGFIKLKASTWTNGKIENVLNRTEQNCNTGVHGANAWLTIDFGSKLKIKPTAYTLKHDNNGTSYALRTWNFEGSNDGNNWVVLKKHQNETSLNSEYATRTWNIQCNESYQMFRIYMTGKDSSGYWVICCSGFEIYGRLTGNN